MKQIYINLNKGLNSRIDPSLSSQLSTRVPLQAHFPVKAQLDMQLYYQLRSFIHETLAKKYSKL